MKRGTTLSGLAFFLILTGCAGTMPASEEPDVELRLAEMGLFAGEGNSYIPSYRVNGWSKIDDYNLIISAGVGDKYLVKLFTPCPELRSAFMIGFTTPNGPGGRLDRFESIVVRGPGGYRERCNIEDIIKLEEFSE